MISEHHQTCIGESRAVARIREIILRIASCDGPVLISGESGTGKELAARLLVANSRRRNQPMLSLNCAALSSNLLESELFGHERGAFTGAEVLRKGCFELADGGSLLLDEVSEMPLDLQPKLLRVLQEGEYQRVGSSVTRRADVRVIATTNRRIEDAVRDNQFRADLFYRLNVLPLTMPPLRERKEDIPLLVEHFLRKFSHEEERERPVISRRAMDRMCAHSWPGNVRELQNVCRRAVSMFPGGALSCEVLESWLSGSVTAFEARSLRDGRILADAERQLIEKTLTRFGGHRERTARALGIGVRTLGMKLKQWRDETSRARV